MPTERMEEVEVVCGWCHGTGDCSGETAAGPFPHDKCDCGGKNRTAKVPEGSLTAARLRLADAAEAKEIAYRKRMVRIQLGVDCSVDLEYHEACSEEDAAEDLELEAFDALAALRTARGEG